MQLNKKNEVNVVKVKKVLFCLLAIIYIVVTHLSFILLLVFTKYTTALWAFSIPFIIVSFVSYLMKDNSMNAEKNQEYTDVKRRVKKTILVAVYIAINIITVIGYTLLTIFINQNAWIFMMSLSWIYTIFFHAFFSK